MPSTREDVREQRPDLVVLPGQQAGQHLHDRDLAAESAERLGQLAADRTAAQHQQARRQLGQFPDAVRGDVGHVGEAREWAARRAARRREHDAARRIVVSAAVDLDGPRAT